MPTYGRCPKKHKAREATIIRAWEKLTGLSSIPEGQQFWTLCGPMADHDGGLQPFCELSHLVRSGLLRTDQYHGVEMEEPLHLANVRAVAGIAPPPHLYHGELGRVMEEALMAGTFAPAIVNLDTICEPVNAARLLGLTLHLLNRVGGVKMVVLNSIIDAPRRGRRYSLDALADAINDNLFCARQLRWGWRQSQEGWVYNGTGKTSVKMGTLVFYQPYQEVACSA